MNAFSEGLEVLYKNQQGTIRFLCDSYLTICIHTSPNPMKDVCIVVHKTEWDDIELVSGNRNTSQ